MAALLPVSKALLQTPIACLAARCLHTSSVLHRTHIRVGKFKTTKKRTNQLTYEEAKGPHLIGVEKSWLTWNTSNLLNEGRKSECVVEDQFVRNFLYGTWHGMLASEIVIKRRHNMIFLAGYIVKKGSTLAELQRIYFLIGYTEELLSHYLKCPVKLELQAVDSHKDMVFKCI